MGNQYHMTIMYVCGCGNVQRVVSAVKNEMFEVKEYWCVRCKTAMGRSIEKVNNASQR